MARTTTRVNLVDQDGRPYPTGEVNIQGEVVGMSGYNRFSGGYFDSFIEVKHEIGLSNILIDLISPAAGYALSKRYFDLSETIVLRRLNSTDRIRREISTPQQFSDILNSPHDVYELVNDIDMAGFDYDIPGYRSSMFTGVLNGNGYKVKNLSLTPTPGVEYEFAAIFPEVSGGYFHDVHFENCSVNGFNASSAILCGSFLINASKSYQGERPTGIKDCSFKNCEVSSSGGYLTSVICAQVEDYRPYESLFNESFNMIFEDIRVIDCNVSATKNIASLGFGQSVFSYPTTKLTLSGISTKGTIRANGELEEVGGFCGIYVNELVGNLLNRVETDLTVNGQLMKSVALIGRSIFGRDPTVQKYEDIGIVIKGDAPVNFVGGLIGEVHQRSDYEGMYSVLNKTISAKNLFVVLDISGTETNKTLLSHVESRSRPPDNQISFSFQSTDSYIDQGISLATENQTLIPKSTPEMKIKTTFVNWDFYNVWRMKIDSYPRLFFPTKSKAKCERINITKLLGGY